MNAKEATFDLLDLMLKINKGSSYPPYEFTGIELKSLAEDQDIDKHYPDTYLRYMREYRQERGVKITCINKRKSLYRIER